MTHTSNHVMSTVEYRKTGRQTSLHRRPGVLRATDMVQLQHFNRSISFYMLLSDTRAFVNKVAGSGGHGLPWGWQSAFSPHDVHQNGCQGTTIIISAVGAGVFPVTPGNRIWPVCRWAREALLSSTPRQLLVVIVLTFKLFVVLRGFKEKSKSRTEVSFCERSKSSRSALRTLFWRQN